jgi:hypothetical protein
MANDYRLLLSIRGGSGNITVNGVAPVEYYTEGDSLTIAIALNPGFSNIKWYSSPNNTLLSSSLSFTYTMPSRDVKMYALAEGASVPINTYGLKYEGIYGTNFGGQCWNLKIYKLGYTGDLIDLLINDITYSWGNKGDDPLDTIIGSSVDFTIAGETGEFNEFLEGGNRSWNVVLSRQNSIFFSGYISPDFITSPFSSGKKLFSFTAIDGLKGLDSVRSDYASWPSPRTQAIHALVGSLNQSFIDKRQVWIGCNIYETRMTDDLSVFEQFNIPPNSIYTDGEDAKFTNGVRIANEQLFLSETITRLVNPFLCKVFLWQNRFYVIRIDEYNKNSFRVFPFRADGTSTLSPGSALYFNYLPNRDCGLNMPEQTAHRAYTEFNTYLNLGVLDVDSQGGVFDAKFQAAEWYVNSPVSPYPNTYQLSLWDYVRAIPTNQVNSVPTGSTALVQYVSNAGGEYCQIWTTTTTAGTSDPNISYIMASSSSTGGDIVIAQETSNTISLTFEYMVERVGGSDSITPAGGTHAVGLMVKIGDSYLYRDTTTTFDWTATETIMEFPVTAGSVWNIIAINNVLVPEDGQVEIRLYQLICKSGTANRYVIRYENLSLKIEKTDGLSLEKIGVKAITDLPYSNVHPDYDTFIGDAITSNSVSAIKLVSANNEVSELWSRDGVEQLPLLEVISQELANIKGRPNLRILTKFRRDFAFVPWVGLGIMGKYWLPISYELDCRSGNATIEFYDLGEITT